MNFLKVRNVLNVNNKNKFYAFVFIFFFSFYAIYQMRFAYFYNDDFFLMQNPNFSIIYELYNGHWIPIINGTYWVLFESFGVKSYLPWLILSVFFYFTGVFLLFKSFSSTGNKIVLFLILGKVVTIRGSEQTLSWTSVAINFFIFAAVVYYIFGKRFTNTSSLFLLCLFLIGIGGYGLPGLFLVSLSEFVNFLRSRVKLRNVIVSVSFTFLSFIIHLYGFLREENDSKLIPEDFHPLKLVTTLPILVADVFRVAFPWSVSHFIFYFLVAILLCFYLFTRTIPDRRALYLGLYGLLFWVLILLNRGYSQAELPSRYISISVSCLLLSLYFFIDPIFQRVNLFNIHKVIIVLLILTIAATCVNVVRSFQNISWQGRITQGNLSALMCSYEKYGESRVFPMSDKTLVYVKPMRLFSLYPPKEWPNLSTINLRHMAGPAIDVRNTYISNAKQPRCFIE
jgi:hypothetical protein